MTNAYLAGYLCGYLNKGVAPRLLGYHSGYLSKRAEQFGSSEGGGMSSNGAVTEKEDDQDTDKKKKDPNNPWVSPGIASNTVPTGTAGSSALPPDHGQ